MDESITCRLRGRWVPLVGILTLVSVPLVSGCGAHAPRAAAEKRGAPVTSGSSRTSSGAVPQPPGQSARAGTPTVVAAGDISPQRIHNQKATSDLVLRMSPSKVLALGDEQYTKGSLADFRRYYEPTWGRFKAKTEPTPGNHEYETPGAAGYFAYFGQLAAPSGKSYYSYDLGAWHLVSLNSNIARGAGSAQEKWLRADLARTHQRCVLAYWHHPRFSSGARHGNDPSVGAFWTDLYAKRVDVVLNGHEHNYERFAQQTPGAAATSGGVREFVVGTGGNGSYPFGTVKRNSQKRLTNTFGVLQLSLRPTSYSWKFVNTKGAVLDSGGPQSCH